MRLRPLWICDACERAQISKQDENKKEAFGAAARVRTDSRQIESGVFVPPCTQQCRWNFGRVGFTFPEQRASVYSSTHQARAAQHRMAPLPSIPLPPKRPRRRLRWRRPAPRRAGGAGCCRGSRGSGRGSPSLARPPPSPPSPARKGSAPAHTTKHFQQGCGFLGKQQNSALVVTGGVAVSICRFDAGSCAAGCSRWADGCPATGTVLGCGANAFSCGTGSRA